MYEYIFMSCSYMVQAYRSAYECFTTRANANNNRYIYRTYSQTKGKIILYILLKDLDDIRKKYPHKYKSKTQ